MQRLAEGMGITFKRHGADLLGLCPFHDDKEPSLVADGLVRRQASDPGGRLTRLLSGPGVQDLRYAYDQADNLIARHDWVSPAEGRGYAYDALNRLEEVSGAGLDLYTYDALGNRQSRVTTEQLEHYRYDPESGRLRQREPGEIYDYDAGGQTKEDENVGYDLEAVSKNGEKVLCIEVKGRGIKDITADFTVNKYKAIRSHQKDCFNIGEYIICIVTNVGRPNMTLYEFHCDRKRKAWFDNNPLLSHKLEIKKA